MKTFLQIENILKAHKDEIYKKYKIKDIAVFGSYVKGKADENSDLDILVELESTANLSLLGYIGLENYLSSLLGIKVDLVEKNGLKPFIGERILNEAMHI
ncbi:MAG: nucleotidyltransferase family protein [bacterium]